MFWSYLWGIEIRLPVSPLPCSLRFDLTYEGLKYFTAFFCVNEFAVFWSYLWGIEIIYNFYNMELFLLFWSYLWGIEIYIPFLVYSQYFFVLILPMRDWNTFHTQNFSFQLRRFDLTYEGLKFAGCMEKSFGSMVLILPMRDWNDFNPNSIETEEHVLILPMRDWNFNFLLLVIGPIAVLILPMRDWNSKS